MQTGSPFAFRRHKVVVVPLQFAQLVPVRRVVDCNRRFGFIKGLA